MPATVLGREIEAVVFDLGDTLISIDPPLAEIDAAFVAIAELLTTRGYDPVPAAARLRAAVGDEVDDLIARTTEDDVEIDHRELAERAYARLGLTLDAETLTEVIRIEQKAWHAGVELEPGALAVINRLCDAGLKTGICSNAPYDRESMVGLIDRLGLTRMVHNVTLSTESGFRKPSPRMFEFTTRALGVSPEATVFVGDKQLEDVQGARSAGMLTIRTRRFRNQTTAEKDADFVIDDLIELLEIFCLQAR